MKTRIRYTSCGTLVRPRLNGRLYGWISVSSLLDVWEFAIRNGIDNHASALLVYMLMNGYPKELLDYTRDFL